VAKQSGSKKVLAEEHERDKKNPDRIGLALRHWASKAAAQGEKREEGDAVRDGALWGRLNPESPAGTLTTCPMRRRYNLMQ
jgi:hypothetical protein